MDSTYGSSDGSNNIIPEGSLLDDSLGLYYETVLGSFDGSIDGILE